MPPGPAGEQTAVVTFTYDIDGILHVSAQSSGGDFRERLILNPNLHLTEEGKVQAMERIRQIQLFPEGEAAPGALPNGLAEVGLKDRHHGAGQAAVRRPPSPGAGAGPRHCGERAEYLAAEQGF